jgi:hypothetical protein
MNDRRTRLTILWIFVLFNYLYCDIVGLMDSGLLRQYLIGHVNGMDIGQGFLLAGAALMELPMAMIVVSWLTPDQINRRANIVAGSVMTIVQSVSLVSVTPTAYYVFFSIVEIGCTALIVRFAWTWRTPRTAPVTGASATPASVQS